MYLKLTYIIDYLLLRTANNSAPLFDYFDYFDNLNLVRHHEYSEYIST